MKLSGYYFSCPSTDVPSFVEKFVENLTFLFLGK
jgi:hypothetical protein